MLRKHHRLECLGIVLSTPSFETDKIRLRGLCEKKQNLGVFSCVKSKDLGAGAVLFHKTLLASLPKKFFKAWEVRSAILGVTA